jgi:hypothetical protein
LLRPEDRAGLLGDSSDEEDELELELELSRNTKAAAAAAAAEEEKLVTRTGRVVKPKRYDEFV